MADRQFNATPHQRQEWADLLRAALHGKGAYPTEQGERAVEGNAGEIHQDLIALLPGLETTDLFCLEVLAHHFTDTEAAGWRDRWLARDEALRQRDPANEPPGLRWKDFTIALGYARHLLATWGRSLWRHKLTAR